MYVIDARDRSCLSTSSRSRPPPCPLVIQDEHTAVVEYYVEVPEPSSTGKWLRVVDPEASEEPAAPVRFGGVYATMFGPPNEEVFHGHPLAARGLRLLRRQGSSWIRALARMNSVHPPHRPEAYAQLRHFVLACSTTPPSSAPPRARTSRSRPDRSVGSRGRC